MSKQKKRTENVGEGEATPRRAKSAPQSLLMTYSVIIAAILVILAGIREARSILGPFLMATFFAVLLVTPMNWIKKKGVSTGLALTLVITVTVVCGLVGTTIMGSQIAQFAKELPQYRDRFNETLRENNISIEEFLPTFLRSDPDKNTEQDKNAEEGESSEKSKEGEVERDRESAPEAAGQEPTPLRKVAVSDQTKFIPSDLDAASDGVEGQTSPQTLATSVAYMERMDSDANHFLDAEADMGVEGENAYDSSELADGESRSGGVKSGSRTIGVVEMERPNLSLGTPPESFMSGAENAFRESEQDDADSDKQAAVVADSPIHAPITAVDASSQSLFQFLGGLAGELSYLGSTTFIVMLLVVFMLVETANLPKKMVAVLGITRFKNTHIENVIADIRHYMVIKTEMSMIIGVCVVVLLTLTKVKYPILWGIVAFLLNYIPNIGSVVASAPPIVLAIVDCGLPTGCVVTVALVVINCTVGYAIEPRLLGKGLGLSPLIVLMSLIFFGWLLGPVGMFLSPPLAVVMKIIFQAFPETRWMAGLMANKPPESSMKEQNSEEQDQEAIVEAEQ